MLTRLALRRPAPGTVLGALALFIVLGGAGYAATGDNFITGKSNTATTLTKLSANTATLPSLVVQNTAGMPAVGFNVTPGTPPFRVSSSMTVTNLSADRLDGINSAGFMQGGGRLYQHSALVSPGASDTVITVGPGNSDESFHLVYSCPASDPANTNGLVSFFLDSSTGSGMTVFSDNGTSDPTVADLARIADGGPDHFGQATSAAGEQIAFQYVSIPGQNHMGTVWFNSVNRANFCLTVARAVVK